MTQKGVRVASPALRKPAKRHHIAAYDYHECRDYLQARDGYDERDYAGTFAGHPEAPYQDFWHFVLTQAPHICSEGAFFVMEDAWAVDAEPWQQAIVRTYLDAFGETDADGERCIDFYVAW